MNKKQYAIPLSLDWQSKHWDLRAALIFVECGKIGHYVSIARSHSSHSIWRLFDDDKVKVLRPRSVAGALRSNKYGFVYGLIYEQTA